MNWVRKILSPSKSKSTQSEFGIQRPLNQSYKGAEHVYAGEYPGDKNAEKAKEKLEQMHRFGVRFFIDLTEENELIPYQNLLPPDTGYIRFPIRDVNIPTSIAFARKIVNCISDEVQREKGDVYVHCWGGVGRTGTIIACYLAEHMETPDVEAVMNELHSRFAQMPKSAFRQTPETKEQEQFIKQYIADVQERHACRAHVKDKIRGSLIGGAIGDALGYPVEFLSRKEILAKYGSDGITRYDLASNGKAVVSDDTQMTLFTANGLLFGVTRFCTHGILGAGLKDYVRYAYLDWYETQTGVENYTDYHYCWIRDIAELNVQRAPGNTCMSALQAIKLHKEVQNDSKGCGGVMRVAPVGLMAAADEQVIVKNWSRKDVPRRTWDNKEIVRLGGDCAELTHKHPLGYLPAAFMADLIYYIMMHNGEITFAIMEQFLHDVDADCRREYKNPNEQKALDELRALIEKAVRLASDSRVADEYAILQLGEGWTGDEALAIALYCAMRHLHCFEDAVIAAVNHDGDSDSTGAICGNIMGAIMGLDGIPNHYIDRLELKDLIIDLADDLLTGCTISEYHSPSTPEEELWEKRYVKIEPASLTCFNGTSAAKEEYTIMPKAKRVMNVKQLDNNLHSASGCDKYRSVYQMALNLFDTDTFDPLHPLPYHRRCDEPRNYSEIKENTPAYYYGYSDRQYSPYNNCRVFKLNVLCFEEEHPVIAFRIDGSGRTKNDLRAGLREYNDESLARKYPGWTFYLIDRTTVDSDYHAVFTNHLEDEFAVEIAHLWEDGTLHCIYYLCY